MAWCCLELVSKRGFGIAIVATFALDLLVCFVVFLLGRFDEQEANDDNRFAASTADTINCCIVRCVFFPLLSFFAYRAYHRKASESPIMQLKEAERRAAQTSGEQRDVEGGTSLSVPLNGGVSEPAVNGNSGANGHAPADPNAEAKAAFKMKEQHTLTMKKADRQRNFVLAGLFALSTGMSMYNGLKCVEFHYDTHRMALEAIQATLLSAVIFMINVEFFLIRDFLGKMTEEEGELIPSMHMHPLFFETDLKCHVCDICHESMKKPHYVAYRCRTCDFDLCPRCYKQKDKPSAKGFGGRAIRRDGEQLTTWTFFVRILQLSLEFKWSMAAAIGSLVVVQMLSLFVPRLQGNIFDCLIKGLNNASWDSKSAFGGFMFLYLFLNILQGLFGGLKSLFQELVMRKLACAVRSKLFSSVIRMDIAFFDGMHTGQLTSRLTNDASQMVQPLSTLMNDLLANLISLVGGAFMAFATSWKLSILALTVVPPITFAYRLYAQWGRKVNRSIYCAYGEGNSTATEAIHNIRTVRAFSTERHEMEKYDDSINTALSHGVKNAYVSGSVNAFASYMTSGTAVLILWFGGSLVLDTKGEQMTVGSLITFQLYWNMMNTGFIALSNVFNDLIRASSAAERVCSLIDARPEVDPDDGDQVAREAIKGNLELVDVQFRYRTRPEHIVLKGINLTMPPCTTTALVGKSGGGKSTLVHLLMRFYEPTEGRIMLDGRDTRELSSRSVRMCCGFVAQETQLFASSITDNLAYGLGREPDHSEVVEACEKANAHEFIMETEDKYETRVGEKGVLLSGGQRQRLAIARCFLRKPRLLFLDEATSALDSENEGIVQASLEKLITELKCTVVLIAHRLCTVINATQIAVIHKGQVIERGHHEELIALGGTYANLVRGQMVRDANAVMEGKEKGNSGKQKIVTVDDLFEDMEKDNNEQPKPAGFALGADSKED